VERYDVAILGGGLAGLSLAIQLKRARPETSVVVFEKRERPVPEAAHKVGESTLQIGAHYFREVCGMGAHLEASQLPKMGLRFFLPAGPQAALHERIEMGLATWADDAPTYQLDRGRFENALAEAAEGLGVHAIDGTRVTEVDLDESGHTVTVRTRNADRSVAASWVIDASGRAAILKRKLGLTRSVPHHCNAAWFRLADQIKIDDWSDDEAWRGRVPGGTRWLSTNHLMGKGYWFWVIPLASGSTSFGLVADPDCVPFEQMRRFESLMSWLHGNEPHVACRLEPHRADLQDFRILKHYSHACDQVYSRARWCITGEAGVFLDPLYSPGSDAIAISNTMITKFVTGSLNGKDIDQAVLFFNDLYLLICSRLLATWDHQYPIFGNPEVAAAKITWDFVTYFSALALLAVTQLVANPRFMISVLAEVDRIAELNLTMQRYFRDWNDRASPCADSVGMLTMSDETYRRLENDVAAASGDPEWVRTRLAENARRVEAAAIDVIAHSAPRLGVAVDAAEVNPYVFRLSSEPDDPHAERWRPPAQLLRALDEVPTALERVCDEKIDSGLRWSTPGNPGSETTYAVWLPDVPVADAGRG
jgi:flavin-dependent dehydrogenase